tara:strand:- start:391 stop:1143 length:753 start_codon:yes stop_codon:yes gene_type:complete
MIQRKIQEAESEYKEVYLDHILVDAEYHSRGQCKQEIINRYEAVYRMELEEDISPSQMPPLEVALINDVLVLFDGFHRYEALRKIGKRSADVCIHFGRDYRELPYLGAKGNLLHGLPMSTRDVRKIVFRAYVRSKSNRIGKCYKSYREIAKDFSNLYVHNTFRKWMKEDFPSVFEAMSSEDGGEIKFEPLDPDKGHLEAGQDALEHLTNRYASIKSAECKAELLMSSKATLRRLLDGAPPNYKQYEEDEF